MGFEVPIIGADETITFISVVLESPPPKPSTTVSLTVYSPDLSKLCQTWGPEEGGLASPKSHIQSTIPFQSGLLKSVDAIPSNSGSASKLPLPSNLIRFPGATNAPPSSVLGTFQVTPPPSSGISNINPSSSLGQLNVIIGTGNGFSIYSRKVFGADSKPRSSTTVRETLCSPGLEKVLLTEVEFSIGDSLSEKAQ